LLTAILYTNFVVGCVISQVNMQRPLTVCSFPWETRPRLREGTSKGDTKCVKESVRGVRKK